jgi:hypothetical protein
MNQVLRTKRETKISTINAVLKLVTVVRYYQNENKGSRVLLHCFLPSSRNKHGKHLE